MLFWGNILARVIDIINIIIEILLFRQACQPYNDPGLVFFIGYNFWVIPCIISRIIARGLLHYFNCSKAVKDIVDLILNLVVFGIMIYFLCRIGFSFGRFILGV